MLDEAAKVLFERALMLKSSRDPRDGDGDGLINDGTPQERPVYGVEKSPIHTLYLKREGQVMQLPAPKFKKLLKELKAGRGGSEILLLMENGFTEFIGQDGEAYDTDSLSLELLGHDTAPSQKTATKSVASESDDDKAVKYAKKFEALVKKHHPQTTFRYEDELRMWNDPGPLNYGLPLVDSARQNAVDTAGGDDRSDAKTAARYFQIAFDTLAGLEDQSEIMKAR